MSSKKSYNRFFIIFQEEDKGYGIGQDRPPTGYAKVETKNDKSKVTVYVQNLKPYETGECLYKCYLISHQDEKDSTVYLGMVSIDDLGRGESSWECSAENAFDSKVPIEKYNGAAIVVEQEGMDKVIAPLAGYMSKEKFDWRSKITTPKQQAEAKKEEDLSAKAEVEEKLSEQAKKFDEYEKSVEVLIENKEVEKEAVQELEVKVDVEKKAVDVEFASLENIEQKAAAQTINEPAPVEIPRNTESEEAVQPAFEENKPENGVDDDLRHKHMEHKYCHHYPGYSGMDYRIIMGKMLEDILADYEKLGKHKDLKDCVLWKVDMEKCRRDGHKIGMYPCYDLVFYPMLYNPYFNHFKYIKKHGHYLFGLKCDKDRRVIAIVFGMAGKKKPCDQPFEGKTGFAKWIPLGAGDDGYWIMMYDPMTGIIITQK